MIWYYKILANRPCLIISTIGTVATSCLIISIYTNTFPDFTDPAMGFEARGTDVGIRLNTWYNLESECGPSGRLVSDPMQLELSRNHIYKNPLISETNKKRKKKKKFHKYNHKTANTFYEKGVPNFKQRIPETSFNSNFSNHLNFKAKKNKSEHNFFGNLKSATKIGEFDKYFCDSPRKMYAHFVVERISSDHLKSLFDVDSFLSICELQDRVTNVNNYEEYCEIDAVTNSCCRPWSLPNYAALVANKTSCFELKVEDVLLLKKIWTFCKEFYYGIKVNRQCNDDILCGAPPECMHNDLYIAFEYLTDGDFLNSNISENMFLKYSMIFVPVIKDPKILSLYYEWQKADLKTDMVKIVGMDLGLENDLFNDLLINDCWLLALGAVIIFTSMWLYTNSLFVTVMSSIAVCFSLGLSYFIYTIVFGMVFFPYLNLLAVVVIIGIGADDAFVFIRIWQCNKLHLDDVSQSSFVKLLALTFHQATSSMFVTSMTTAFAFFASYTSNITSIKCFGLFAGTAVFTNFLLMITWLPASIAMMEQIFKSRSITMRQPRKIIEFLKEKNSKLFEKFSKIVKILVIKYSYMWINLFAVLGVLSFIIVFYWPGFKLPINHIFQPFSSQHPFQLYNTKLKKEFAFENAEMVYESFKMPLRFVWGVLPIDDGDYTDPSSRGSLQYDNNFDMNTIQSQMWLLKFCQNLRQQWFTELKTGQLQSDCFLENFISIMNRKCFDGMSEQDLTPCCDISKFPYNTSTFEFCLPLIMSSLYATPRQYFIPNAGGPKFDSQYKVFTSYELYKKSRNQSIELRNTTSRAIRAVVLEITSNILYNTSHTEMEHFFGNVKQWFTDELKTAPPEMQNGWFISELKYFDLQKSLKSGTLVSILVAMCTALVILFLVTLNLLVSLYAVLTVCLSIFTSIAILILFGWTLGVLESVAISTAIGLTVDFSLHYGIHYKMALSVDRVTAAEFALDRIVGATAMAFVTTVISGALMLVSSVMPFIQIGLFLVIVMTVSWLFSTFFLMSLLKVGGPENRYKQVKLPKIRKKTKEIEMASNDGTNNQHKEIFELNLLTPKREIPTS